MSRDTPSGDPREGFGEPSVEPETLRPDRKSSDDGSGDGEELPPPTGTLFLLMLYIMLTAGMWGGIYLDFLGR